MARGIVPPRVTVETLFPQVRASCHGRRTSRSRGELARGGTCHTRRRLVTQGRDLSCGVETCRARQRLVTRGEDSSCKAETCHAGRRLVVRGGDSSEGVPLVGNWSEMLPIGRKRDVLLVWVLTGVLSLPRLES
jgi:hypothetical protein